ncbi:chalcone-flavanone isomerase-domain-containing protein [Cercophora newfieldiana]|uniref:Chalcone-flavanone isomerase-domain-containing protein n=1 Tax=Cercophora newfieldiana TaxID=92897 RepID=A0AA39YHK8_9PEZI|nr:chalcone-flavanone isomerase-domain-containing protein [Cercophora newfieldiana]
MFRNAGLRRLPRSVDVRIPRRTFLSRRAEMPSSRPVENLNIHELSKRSHDYQRNRRIFLWSGTVAGVVSFVYTAYKLQQELTKPAQLDSSLPSSDPLSGTNAAERKVVVRDEEGRELVETGNTTVPTFPRTISIPPPPASTDAPAATLATGPTEYTLVGLGLRSVTFVGIQVYVVGYYIATADIAALQNALTKKINPIATTLVPGERDQLRSALLDPVAGEQAWDELLAQGIPARSAFRVIPVRDTDFHHLRDGFVRAIQAKAPTLGGQRADDEAFGEAMRQFRAIFNRGSVPKRKELLLVRDEKGRLNVEYDDGTSKKKGGSGARQLIGTVDDERVSRALWLNWLAGKKVASEPARQSIVAGIIEFVERPVGTVAAQVV